MKISGNTEMTDNEDARPSCTWVVYDGNCVTCRKCADIARRFLDRDKFAFDSLTSPWVEKALEGTPAENLREMALLTVDGSYIGGPEAVRMILAEMPGGRVPVWISRLRGFGHS